MGGQLGAVSLRPGTARVERIFEEAKRHTSWGIYSYATLRLLMPDSTVRVPPCLGGATSGLHGLLLFDRKA